MSVVADDDEETVLLGVSMAAVGLALGLLIGRWWAVLFAIPVALFFQPKMSARSRTLRSVSSLEYRWPSAYLWE